MSNYFCKKSFSNKSYDNKMKIRMHFILRRNVIHYILYNTHNSEMKSIILYNCDILLYNNHIKYKLKVTCYMER